jgi:hypothetical protein
MNCRGLVLVGVLGVAIVLTGGRGAVMAAEEGGADLNARLYLDMFEIDRYASHADVSADLMKTRFRLLEKPVVQADLELTADQVKAIELLHDTTWDDMPGVNDLIEQHKATFDAAGRKGRRREGFREVVRAVAAYQQEKLDEILSGQQQGRLEQILLQTHGPVLIVVQGYRSEELALSSEQEEQITFAVHFADAEFVPLLQELGRGFVSGFMPGETQESRTKSLDRMASRIKELIRGRDEGILDQLSSTQLNELRQMQGAPLALEWGRWGTMDKVFTE